MHQFNVEACSSFQKENIDREVNIEAHFCTKFVCKGVFGSPGHLKITISSEPS
jgi:hypothetical protein